MNFSRLLAVVLIVSLSYLAGFFAGNIFNGFFEPQKDLFLAQGLAVLSPEKLEAATFIAAVDPDGHGLLSRADVEIIDGRGRVLFNTNPFVEPDTQLSLETAARVAFDFTKADMSKKDVIFSVSQTPSRLIGGPSAGGAFTVSAIAALEGKKVKDDVAMTGTIEKDGSIGPVGGIIEKATAASEKGVKLFLVPNGQTNVIFYKQVVDTKSRGNFTIQTVRLVPQTLDLVRYAKENFNGLEIKEVGTVGEAVKLMVE